MARRRAFLPGPPGKDQSKGEKLQAAPSPGFAQISAIEYFGKAPSGARIGPARQLPDGEEPLFGDFHIGRRRFGLFPGTHGENRDMVAGEIRAV